MTVKTVKVSNVSPGVSAQDIKDIFSSCGDIEYVEMSSGGERLQVAYVTFKDSQGAEAALCPDAVFLNWFVITPATDYGLPHDALAPPGNKDTQAAGQSKPIVRDAGDVLAGLLAKGFLLASDVNKAKSFDENNQFTATAKVASFDKKIGLSEKITKLIPEEEEEVEEEELTPEEKERRLACLSYKKSWENEVGETLQEVTDYRKFLGIETFANEGEVPNPIKMWKETGLPIQILDIIEEMFGRPTPVQAQALPLIMSRRDCIAISGNSSGKTLAFVLPLLRFIVNEEHFNFGGPIGIIISPTSELANQTYLEVQKFELVMKFKCVQLYEEGSELRQMIEGQNKVLICTPTTLTGILDSGRNIIDFGYVKYVAIDEADQMLESYLAEVDRILKMIPSGRQTVLFSATFPAASHILADKFVNEPVVIYVSDNTVNRDIAQSFELLEETLKFLRLRHLMLDLCNDEKMLIFVNSKQRCEELHSHLLKFLIPCVRLHEGMGQYDRKSSFEDFKSAEYKIMIATNLLSRGIDIKELKFVVSVDTPGNYKDYVNRIGRVRRGGRGRAVTFVSKFEAQYVFEILKGLECAGHAVPEKLRSFADDLTKNNLGRGFKFD